MNQLFWQATSLSCEDLLWTAWRKRGSVQGCLPAEQLSNIQPALLCMKETSARKICADGPVKELIESTVMMMLRKAQQTVAGTGSASVPAAATGFFIKVGMTTCLIARFQQSRDGIADREMKDFLGLDDASPILRDRCYVGKGLDETYDGDGVTCICVSVVLGLIDGDVPGFEARSADGMERCVYEVVAGVIEEKQATISEITSGRKKVLEDNAANIPMSALTRVARSDDVPRLACINTLAKDIVAACNPRRTSRQESRRPQRPERACPGTMGSRERQNLDVSEEW